MSLRQRPPGRAVATNCTPERAVSSLTRPFGPPSPDGRGKIGAACGRRFMGRPLGRAVAMNCAHERAVSPHLALRATLSQGERESRGGLRPQVYG